MAKKKTASGGRSTSAHKSKPRSTTNQSKSKPKSTASKKGASRTSAKSRARQASRRPRIKKVASWPQRVAESWKSARTTLTDPDFWRQVQHQAPPWIDELGAILLIVLGVVSLTALFNTTSEAMLSVTLSRALRQAFGHGAYIVALSVLGAGIILLLPKFGITLRVGLVHVVGSEITFGAFEAMLHLFANDPEARALARSGGGGGYLGWALSQLTSGLGHTLSILIFGILFVAGLVLITGLRREHLVLGVAWMNARLQNGITRLDSLSFEPAAESLSDDSAGIDLETSALSQYSRRTAADPAISYPRHGKPSIVPRESAAEGSELAPSVTQGSVPDPSAPLATATGSDSAASYQGTRSKSKPRQLDPNNRLTRAQKKEIADKARQELGAPNGRSLVAPGEPGERPSIVPRDYLPDARPVPAAPRARVRHTRKEYSSRYFTVDDFQETKKIGRRAEHLPNLDLLNNIELNKPTEDEINTNARIIKHALLEFDVDVEVIDVKVGPTVTQYAVSPYTEVLTEDGETVLNRVRVSQIANLDGDLALALSAKRLRIQAPVPGHSYVGIEVPNRQPSTVALRPVLESEQFYQYRKRPLALPLGRDVSGESFITDLGTMPHLLIAGTTGSGKSIMLASITTAFVMNNPPDRIKLALLDPKMVELSRFNGLPHLLGPVETELDRIIEVLRWATREMEFRYKLLEKEAARNIDIYNKQLGRRRKAERLPYIVIIVDEIGDLMMQRPDETERALTRLAQMARAVGIHLMVATQRPSVDVITGLIKANFPARISFAVASGVDSRVILDSTGAETLMGRGDMLFLAPDASGPQRIQGCYVSDDEVNTVVQYWREWHENEVAEGRMDPPSVAPWERGLTRREVLAETDPMLEDAIALVIAEGEASASLIQRRLGLGYPRAARLIDLMHELGIVGEARAGGRTRNVLVKPGHDPFRKLIDERLKNKP